MINGCISTETVSFEIGKRHGPKPNKGSEENALSPITSQKRFSCGNELAARAVTPKWCAMGGKCIVVLEVPGLKLGGGGTFGLPPFPTRYNVV